MRAWREEEACPLPRGQPVQGSRMAVQRAGGERSGVRSGAGMGGGQQRTEVRKASWPQAL